MDEGAVRRHGAEHGADFRAGVPTLAESAGPDALVQPAHPVSRARKGAENGLRRRNVVLENISASKCVSRHMK